LFNIIPLYLMFKDSTYEKPSFTEKKQGPQHLNKDLTISILIITVFGVNLILTVPVDEIMEWTAQDWWEESFFVPVVITVLFAVLLVFLIGIIFDFIGRVATFTILIIAIAIFNFLSIFQFQIPFVRASLVVGAFIAAFMSIPLLIGDLAKRINYGKILPFTFVIFAFGMGLGILIYIFIEIRRPDPVEAQAILTGAQSLSAIFCLVLLLIGEEALPHKEQEWYESLVHLFVIKDSGILLYEHEFIKEEDRTAQSDLISGGIIGLITMLNEITKGKEKLRAIDHGDKKLMFKFNQKKSVIFTLLIKEDLFVLRNKLDRFVSDFEDGYEEKLEALPTGNTGGWKILSELVEKHFKRKYFQILVSHG
jgi:MFS family permease